MKQCRVNQSDGRPASEWPPVRQYSVYIILLNIYYRFLFIVLLFFVFSLIQEARVTPMLFY